MVVTFQPLCHTALKAKAKIFLMTLRGEWYNRKKNKISFAGRSWLKCHALKWKQIPHVTTRKTLYISKQLSRGLPARKAPFSSASWLARAATEFHTYTSLCALCSHHWCFWEMIQTQAGQGRTCVGGLKQAKITPCTLLYLYTQVSFWAKGVAASDTQHSWAQSVCRCPSFAKTLLVWLILWCLGLRENVLA